MRMQKCAALIHPRFFSNHVVAVCGIGMHEILVETIRRFVHLHDTGCELLTKFRAPMSFFGKTNSGETINRFSQDLSMIDTELPMALFNFVAG
jgi:ATP-binding cassette subfamily C (CFTR/MRP) protein 1